MEGALPDPETAAERLLIIQRLANSKKKEVVVLTRASLDEEAPAPAALKKLEIRLARGTTLDREALIAKPSPPPVTNRRRRFPPVANSPSGAEFSMCFRSNTRFPSAWSCSETRSSPCVNSISIPKPACASRTPARAAARRNGKPHGEIARIHRREGRHRRNGCGRHGHGPGVALHARRFRARHIGAHLHGRGGWRDAAEDFSGAFLDHGLGQFEAGDFVVDELKREQLFRLAQGMARERLAGPYFLQ